VFAADTDILVRNLDLVTLCRLGSGGVNICVARRVKIKLWRKKDRQTDSEGYLAVCVCLCVCVLWRDS
jgi:hypothetical protein